jgi:hypothetical protein
MGDMLEASPSLDWMTRGASDIFFTKERRL